MPALFRITLRVIFTAIALLPSPASGQVAARWNGYLEHQYSISYTGVRWTQLDYDRVRVDLAATAGRDTRVAAAAVGQLYRGDTRIQLRDVLPGDLAALVDTFSLPIENRFYLNHAYVMLRPGPLEVTAGKQYLAWGAAWAFNPTELFRPKNVLEPTYEREGVGALAVRLPLGPLSDMRVGLVPDGRFRTSGKFIRARHHLGGFDVSGLAVVLYEPTTPLGFFPGIEAEARRTTLGGDLTGELFGLGAWAEAAWSDHDSERWVEATVGSNYTLRDGTLLLAEGFYNGRGQWGAPYPPALWLGRLLGNRRSLGKLTVYAAARRPLGALQLWTVGFSALSNVGDPSAVLIPSVAYAFAQDVDLLFNGLLYLGRDGDEYGGRRLGAFLRARVYF